MQKNILLIISPGSACGSTYHKLGYTKSGQAHEKIAKTIRNWKDDIIIIDCHVSEELSHYPLLELAIQKQQERSEHKEILFDRYECHKVKEGQWVKDIAKHIIGKRIYNQNIYVTGAWHKTEEHAVSSLIETLRTNDVNVTLKDCAINLEKAL